MKVDYWECPGCKTIYGAEDEDCSNPRCGVNTFMEDIGADDVEEIDEREIEVREALDQEFKSE